MGSYVFGVACVSMDGILCDLDMDVLDLLIADSLLRISSQTAGTDTTTDVL